MFIAQGMNKFSTPSETKFKALIQLLDFSIFLAEEQDNSWKVTLKANGHPETTYMCSNKYTYQEAFENAVLSTYKQFNIKLYQEI